MRILVTGGSGFIGSNFVRMALSAGHQLTVLDDLSVGDRCYIDGLPARFVHASIMNESLVQEEVSRHDGIVHLAAQSGVPTSLADPRHDCYLNVLGTLNLLEACRTTKRSEGVRFVFASSNAVLGRQLPPATEDKATLPLSPYGASKLAGEAYCLAYHGSWGLGTVALRFGNVYGPYSAHKRSVVARFLHDLKQTGTLTIEGDGLQTRDFVFVGDLCQAILKAVNSRIRGEILQIASGTETSILSLSKLIASIVGRDVQGRHAPARPGEARRNRSDITKAAAMLGWAPQVSLEDGLQQTFEWQRRWIHAQHTCSFQ